MQLVNRRSGRSVLAGALMLMAGVAAAQTSAVTAPLEVYKSPYCGCCGAWVEHMRAAGFRVLVHELENLDGVKARLGVPAALRSCHTAVIDGYVIEGHVPAADVSRLLAERPRATGLAVPGMPVGSPGMEQGARRDAYDVMLFSPTGSTTFARH